MTLIFTSNTKNSVLFFYVFFILLYFQDINAIEINILYEFKYVFPHI